jgi:signal transduction histidine kinase
VRLDVPGNGESAGALVIGHRKGGAFNEKSLELLRSFGNEVQLALRMASLYRALLSERDQFGEIQEEARKKLARDLHDGPTQVIAAIAMRTNFARRQLERDPEAASEELEKVEAMARSTTKEIRNMLFSLRPLILESQGLCAALGQYGDKVWDTHGQAVLLELNRDVENELSAEAQTALFYIVEEAVTNGLKHAAAGEILIRLFRADGEILLEVEDDGVGFNVGAVDANYEQSGHSS